MGKKDMTRDFDPETESSQYMCCKGTMNQAEDPADHLTLLIKYINFTEATREQKWLFTFALLAYSLSHRV